VFTMQKVKVDLSYKGYYTIATTIMFIVRIDASLSDTSLVLGFINGVISVKWRVKWRVKRRELSFDILQVTS